MEVEGLRKDQLAAGIISECSWLLNTFYKKSNSLELRQIQKFKQLQLKEKERIRNLCGAVRQVLWVVKYFLKYYNASVKQTVRARKLKAGFAQTLPNVPVVLLQCLKWEHSINYHDYLKKKKGGG